MDKKDEKLHLSEEKFHDAENNDWCFEDFVNQMQHDGIRIHLLSKADLEAREPLRGLVIEKKHLAPQTAGGDPR